MLKDVSLLLKLWDEAAEANAYIRNRMIGGPIRDNLKISPEEAWIKERPSISHIKIWGSKCYSYINPKSILKD